MSQLRAEIKAVICHNQGLFDIVVDGTSDENANNADRRCSLFCLTVDSEEENGSGGGMSEYL